MLFFENVKGDAIPKDAIIVWVLGSFLVKAFSVRPILPRILIHI